MATYSTRNRLVKQATNENPNTWGTTLNGGMIDMIDEASDGITALALTGDVTLTSNSGATDQARKRVLNITSSDQHARVITIPAVEKWYIVENESAYRVNIKTAAGTAAVVPGGCSAVVKCDATDCFKLMQTDYGIISTSSPTSGLSFVLTLTGFNCRDFLLTFKGLTCAGGNTLSLEFSSDNATWTTAGSFVSTSGANAYYGGIEIKRATDGTGFAVVGVEELTANNTVDRDGDAAQAWPIWPWRLSGGINYVRISSGSNAFSSGSVEVYGK